MTTAYLDCFSGIAGDMLLAAMLDAGLPLEHLQEQLQKLQLDGYQLAYHRADRNGLAAGALRVLVTKAQTPHRSWRDIRALLEGAELKASCRETALQIFATLAAAEAKIHGGAPEEVHFHEVGGVDSIVDIVGVAIGWDFFGITRLLCSPLPLGQGWVESAHGPLPLPAPATLELLRTTPTYGVEVAMELVTPTGAAIVRSLAADFGPPPPLTIEQIGYGAGSGQRPDGRPNLLRLLLGRETAVAEAQEIEVIETQLDDWAAEGFPHLCQRLFELRALDVSLTPLLMKKGRPGYLLRVLADPACGHDLKECLLTETTAIGLRFHRQQRRTLPREKGSVETPWGPIAVKKVHAPDGPRLYPEYESCQAAATRHRVPLLTIHTRVAGLPLTAFIPADEPPLP
ncbi:MAG: nickel pincer cofactor biosynthesis protein LarC [Desulfurivibrio sp.]|nr:nickel pincer cofactor biosynthesis protein LarC [Desulfurivibrio sp.]